MNSENRQSQFLSFYGALPFLIFALLVLLSLILITPLKLNLDSTMYLEIGHYLLEGRLPYVDYVELNPPLIHYINVIPAFIAEISGANPIFVYKLMLFMIVLYSAFMTRYLLIKLSGNAHSLETNIIPIVIVLASVASHSADGAAMFGQREHLLSLFVIPWIVLRVLKASNTPLPIGISILIGIIAAIGIALKPFALIALLLIELYLLIRYRNLRVIFSPEVWAFGLVGVLYLAHFLILPEAVRDGFFKELIPSVRAGYQAFSLGSVRYIVVYFLLFPGVIMFGILWIIGMGLAIVIPRKQSSRIALLSIPFLLFAIGSILAYLLQGIGFLYQAMPFYFAAFIVIAIRLSPGYESTEEIHDNSGKSRLHYVFTAFVIIFISLYSVYASLKDFDPELAEIKDYTLSSSEEGNSIFFVDSGLYPGFPLVMQIRRRSNMTYPVAFPIAFGLYENNNPERLYTEGADLPDEIERYLAQLAADISTVQPTLILIKQEECGACPDDFNIHRMLVANGFIDRNILPDYVLDDVQEIPEFVIYKRR